MPRPSNKQELLNLSQSNFIKIFDFIDKLEEQDIDFPAGTMNRNIRDVLTHLHEWHIMMINWYRIGMSGKKPIMPAEGYTWQKIPDLNKKIWEKYQTTDLEDAKLMVKASFDELQKIIESHSNEELFEKKRYNWTGTTSLASYLISATSSHYDWAFKLIKKSFK